MVKYAGNGLVSHGDTDLKLMRVLFWVFTLGLVAISYGNMPLSKQDSLRIQLLDRFA